MNSTRARHVWIYVSMMLLLGLPAWAEDPTGCQTIEQLRAALERQQERIAHLERLLEKQARLLERLQERNEPQGDPSRSAGSTTSPTAGARLEPAQSGRLEDLDRRAQDLTRNLSGFRFSGDFRYRFDVQARSRNPVAGPLRNIRSRYRLRLNVDKEIDSRFGFHLQLSTSPLNNAITNDQDFGAITAKHPFSIAEAYVDFHPISNLAFRVGRMEEIFADGMRFLWDDDVRFNGFHQTVKIPLRSTSPFLKSVEFRMAEYVLSNPNVAALSPSSPFVDAGFEAGRKVGSANLFHPGIVLQGDFGRNSKYQLTADLQVYRNPNQIQLASTAAGFPILVNNTLGIALAGPLTGTGNATTAPGGAMFHAPNFQIARLAYRLESKSFQLGKRMVPAWLDIQVSRNTGTSSLRDAVIVSANMGAVRSTGDIRMLYQFAIKDANSLISQFTDDDLGTGSGVNIAVHAFRFDLGVTRFLQWQNLFFIQNQKRPSNPADRFFVPLPRGANTTFRYLGQLAFTF